MSAMNLLGDVLPGNIAQGLIHLSTLCYFKNMRNECKLIKEQKEVPASQSHAQSLQRFLPFGLPGSLQSF